MQHALDIDFGAPTLVGSLSLAQINPADGWSGVFDTALKEREDEGSVWKTVYEGSGPVGQVPIIELRPSRARFLRLEFVRHREKRPVRLGELRVLAPLDGTETAP